MPPAPPVVVPNSGNNIIVNPCQVCPNPSNWGELLNALVLERKPSPGMHPKRRERIRGHCGRLSGWEYDRSLVSEVNGPAYRCWRFLIHPACDITVSILNISSHALRSLAVHMTAVSCWYSVTSYVCHLFFFFNSLPISWLDSTSWTYARAHKGFPSLGVVLRSCIDLDSVMSDQ